MNLEKLFEMQRKLDERIVREKGLEGQNLLDKKILALQVELGELANEWRGFKFWSENQEPRTELWKDCNFCGGRGFVSPANYPYGHQKITCIECRGESQFKTNPLLEEYVDCLHFILSIGLDLRFNDRETSISKNSVHFSGDELITQFDEVFWCAASYKAYRDNEKDSWYNSLFSNFLGLGEMLGFTWDEIEESYFEKNRINHERQNNGY